MNDFFAEAQQRANMNPQQLIRSWTTAEITAMSNSLTAASQASGIVNSNIQVPPNTTNQAIGNKIAKHFYMKIRNQMPAGDQFTPATGNGYPDKIIKIQGGPGIAVEMKATSNWLDTDDNRRVLTSSLMKLRTLIAAGDLGNPPVHMICTVFYAQTANVATIRGYRVDHLDPGTQIKIRLEMSTSQSLLAHGNQPVFRFP